MLSSHTQNLSVTLCTLQYSCGPEGCWEATSLEPVCGITIFYALCATPAMPLWSNQRAIRTAHPRHNPMHPSGVQLCTMPPMPLEGNQGVLQTNHPRHSAMHQSGAQSRATGG